MIEGVGARGNLETGLGVGARGGLVGDLGVGARGGLAGDLGVGARGGVATGLETGLSVGVPTGLEVITTVEETDAPGKTFTRCQAIETNSHSTIVYSVRPHSSTVFFFPRGCSGFDTRTKENNLISSFVAG